MEAYTYVYFRLALLLLGEVAIHFQLILNQMFFHLLHSTGSYVRELLGVLWFVSKRRATRGANITFPSSSLLFTFMVNPTRLSTLSYEVEPSNEILNICQTQRIFKNEFARICKHTGQHLNLGQLELQHFLHIYMFLTCFLHCIPFTFVF